jgi:hypothetical protein
MLFALACVIYFSLFYTNLRTTRVHCWWLIGVRQGLYWTCSRAELSVYYPSKELPLDEISQHFSSDGHWFSGSISEVMDTNTVQSHTCRQNLAVWYYTSWRHSIHLNRIYMYYTVFDTNNKRSNCVKAKEYKDICSVLINRIKCTTVRSRQHSQCGDWLWTGTLRLNSKGWAREAQSVFDWFWVGYLRLDYEMWLADSWTTLVWLPVRGRYFTFDHSSRLVLDLSHPSYTVGLRGYFAQK